MAATSITYNGYDLQSATIVTENISHESMDGKMLNIQSFATANGGRLVDVKFNPKKIVIRGVVKGTGKADLEDNLDTLKKNLNVSEGDLDVAYSGEGTRRYVCTDTRVNFDRSHYTIDVISFEAEFMLSSPPFGKNIDTNTIEDLGNSASNPATTTGEYTGTFDYGGTVVPEPRIQITFNSADGVKKLILQNTNVDGEFSRTQLSYAFQTADILIIDLEEGTVKVNNEFVDFLYGFPKFTLTDNNYSLSIVGKAYNVDLKFIYYKLWL